MKKYNPHDVYLLEKLYYKLRPYMPNHPNINLITRIPRACKACLGPRFNKAGFKYNKRAVKQRWQCMNCYTYNLDEIEPLDGKIYLS